MYFYKTRSGYTSDCGDYFITKDFDGYWTAWRNGKPITVAKLINAKKICQNHKSGKDKLSFA